MPQDDHDPRGFSHDELPKPHAFLQWKNTDACFDFYCECGVHCHHDGYFAYTVQCPKCGTVWEMPSNLFPRKAGAETYEYWRDNPQLMDCFGDNDED